MNFYHLLVWMFGSAEVDSEINILKYELIEFLFLRLISILDYFKLIF